MPYIFNNYTITLDKNGASSPLGTPSFTHTKAVYKSSAIPMSGSYSYTLPLPVRGTEVFIGWSLPDGSNLSNGVTLTYDYDSTTGLVLSASGGNSASFSNSNIRNQLDLLASGTATMIAQWDTRYDIVYYNIDGLDNNANPSTYLSSVGANLVGVLKTGYTFGGWFRNPELTLGGSIIYSGTTGVQSRYAKWVPTVYNITYTLYGGDNSPSNPPTYTIESGLINLGSPTRQYYNFGGWYLEAGFATRIYYIASGSTGDLVLYAKWSAKSKSIIYSNLKGANNTFNPTTYYENAASNLGALSLTGYTFTSWSPGAGSPAYAYQSDIQKWVIPMGIGSSVNAYANWTAITYYVYYEENGGSHISNYEFTIESPTATLRLDTFRNGYTFSGWFAEAELINPVYNVPQGTHENKYVFAKWVPVTYTITYNLNGGTNNGANLPNYDITLDTITLLSPTRTGYTFGGWYATADFSGGAITTIPTGSTGNKILYAKWAATPYDITYENVHGAANTNPADYTIETPTITFTSLVRNGYTFRGWYSDSATNNSRPQIFQGTTGNITVYAGWDLISYSITYNLNGGTNNGANPASYNITSAAITLSNPARTGYTFGGWFADSALSVSFSSIPTGSFGNKIAYAKWTVTPYNIIYNLDGGTNNQTNPGTYTYETNTITLGAPSRTGYNFVGWFDAASGGNSVTAIIKNSTGHKTVYARWTIKSAAVTLYNRYIKKDGSVYNQLLTTANFNYNVNIAVPLSDLAVLNKTKESIYTYQFIGWTRNINDTTNDAFTAATYVWDNNLANLLNGVGVMDANLLKGGAYYAVWKRVKSGLKIGTKNIKLKIGESDVEKIIRGSTVIWEKESV